LRDDEGDTDLAEARVGYTDDRNLRDGLEAEEQVLDLSR
jgi:hypothetical protein